MDETYRTIITIYDIFNKQHEVVVYPLSATEIDNTDNNHWHLSPSLISKLRHEFTKQVPDYPLSLEIEVRNGDREPVYVYISHTALETAYMTVAHLSTAMGCGLIKALRIIDSNFVVHNGVNVPFSTTYGNSAQFKYTNSVLVVDFSDTDQSYVAVGDDGYLCYLAIFKNQAYLVHNGEIMRLKFYSDGIWIYNLHLEPAEIPTLKKDEAIGILLRYIKGEVKSDDIKFI